jgi:hypothetical protein
MGVELKQIVYQNLGGSIGHDFRGNPGKLHDTGGKAISNAGRGTVSFLDPAFGLNVR